MSRKLTSLVATAALALCLVGTAFAASSVWLRVITVKTDNLAAYTQQLSSGQAMMKRMGLTVQMRIFRATFAGPNAGTIVVTQEYPTWAALSEAQTKTAADPEFNTWLKSLDALRTITSDSLYREL